MTKKKQYNNMKYLLFFKFASAQQNKQVILSKQIILHVNDKKYKFEAILYISLIKDLY